ncbi:MAG: cytochrome c oxidase subunit II [Nocardioidaceae bacterium]
MGLQLSRRKPLRVRRALTVLVGAVVLVSLTGCSVDTDELKRLGQPLISQGATSNTDGQYDLWKWAWVAAMITGVLVWGLIFFVMIKYRRRSDDEVPVQTRYNLPLEALYTLAPVVMVLVFFYFTLDHQEKLDAKYDHPDHVVEVVGQQWSWTFNYVDEPSLGGTTTVFEPGTPANPPTLYLVKGESVRFNLHSPDVIHDFWVPGFLQKLDVVPGVTNSFDLTPLREGTYPGKCAELCGVYHSRMLFNVKVVDKATFEAQLQALKDKGNVGLVCGPTSADTVAGLEDQASIPDSDPENGVCR